MSTNSKPSELLAVPAEPIPFPVRERPNTSRVVSVELRTEKPEPATTQLLQRFERDVEATGLVGEKNNAKIILLAAVSALLDRPLNITINGASASGKNHLMGMVARFLPEGMKKIITGMSPKALMHSGEDEFEHRVVFIAEYEGVSGADFSIRTMQSEREIQWEFAESTRNGIRKQIKRVKGPAAFIQATTRPVLHPENETRLLFIQMDESQEQTREILRRQAVEAANGPAELPAEMFEWWHKLIGGLKPMTACVLFARQLAEQFPASQIRARRDFPKLLGLIEASAFLHQAERLRDAEGRILATAEDYLAAKHLFEHSYGSGPAESLGQFLEVAEKLREFSVPEVMQATGWGKSWTYALLSRAAEIGCVAETERRGFYRFLRKREEAALNLPAKIRLPAEFFRYSSQRGAS